MLNYNVKLTLEEEMIYSVEVNDFSNADQRFFKV